MGSFLSSSWNPASVSLVLAVPPDGTPAVARPLSRDTIDDASWAEPPHPHTHSNRFQDASCTNSAQVTIIINNPPPTENPQPKTPEGLVFQIATPQD